jgi:transposase-like protein
VKKVKSQKKYSDSLKREVGRRYLREEFSYAVAAEEYGLKDKMVAKEFVKWYRMQLEKGNQADQEEESSKESKVEATAGNLDEALARIKELERALYMAELKGEALETMLDIAKRDLGIDVRKKYGAKQ